MTPRECIGDWFVRWCDCHTCPSRSDCECAEATDAILAALAAAGYDIMPREPTAEMVNAGAIAVLEHRLEGKHPSRFARTGGEADVAYRSMLAQHKETQA